MSEEGNKFLSNNAPLFLPSTSEEKNQVQRGSERLRGESP